MCSTPCSNLDGREAVIVATRVKGCKQAAPFASAITRAGMKSTSRSCYHASSAVMCNSKELAFRYDLFITPDWRYRFNTLVNESIEMPVEGRILDVNCGTGAHTIELAERMRGQG